MDGEDVRIKDVVAIAMSTDHAAAIRFPYLIHADTAEEQVPF